MGQRRLYRICQEKVEISVVPTGGPQDDVWLRFAVLTETLKAVQEGSGKRLAVHGITVMYVEIQSER